jgi:hypothetical protein
MAVKDLYSVQYYIQHAIFDISTAALQQLQQDGGLLKVLTQV